jgi:hypothetical protein
MIESAQGSGWELRRGLWQDALADVEECDTLISDPPYAARTHDGHDTIDRRYDGSQNNLIEYESWTTENVHEFVNAWSDRVRGWFVVMTDHTLARDFESALLARGRYVFAPVIYLSPGSTVRLQGDGPATWAVHIVVARHRTKAAMKWGALPGGYVLSKGYSDLKTDVKQGQGIIGGKPLWIMQALVRDYSRKGDVVCDPCAGAGTTLLASVIERRRAIGSEANQERYEIAKRRLGKGYTPSLF